MPSKKPTRPLPPKPTRRLRAPDGATHASEAGASDAYYARFGRIVTGGVYSLCLESILGPAHGEATSDQAKDAVIRMGARDPAEEMLIQQLVLAHGRVQRMTALLAKQTSVGAIRILSECAERASNTYRRLLLALAEYRSPPRTGDTFAVARQANFAQQQVVQNQEISNGNATNEQGFPSTQRRPATPSPALPAECEGADRASVFRAPVQAVAAVNRTTQQGG